MGQRPRRDQHSTHKKIVGIVTFRGWGGGERNHENDKIDFDLLTITIASPDITDLSVTEICLQHTAYVQGQISALEVSFSGNGDKLAILQFSNLLPQP